MPTPVKPGELQILSPTKFLNPNDILRLSTELSFGEDDTEDSDTLLSESTAPETSKDTSDGKVSNGKAGEEVPLRVKTSSATGGEAPGTAEEKELTAAHVGEEDLGDNIFSHSAVWGNVPPAAEGGSRRGSGSSSVPPTPRSSSMPTNAASTTAAPKLPSVQTYAVTSYYDDDDPHDLGSTSAAYRQLDLDDDLIVHSGMSDIDYSRPSGYSKTGTSVSDVDGGVGHDGRHDAVGFFAAWRRGFLSVASTLCMAVPCAHERK
ncbi:hypothetical protein HK104_006792 [Borealophlyctis nickersoniae]|nr:hypothetical protein HK104_006792 [Borealophlyctis nickersoniae]